MINSCGIFLVNNEDQILVCHATNSPWNSWGIPKGLAEEGEDLKSAAIREFHEETSVNLQKLLNLDCDLHYLGKSEYKNGKKTLIAYWALINKTIPINQMSCTSMVIGKEGRTFPEVDKFLWIDFEKASTVLYLPQRNILPKLIEQINELKQAQLSKIKISLNEKKPEVPPVPKTPKQRKIKIIRKTQTKDFMN